MTSDPGHAIAEVAYTSEHLDRLFRDRPEYWDYAAFASLLVQGRNNLARAIETHRAGYAPPSGKRVGTVAEL